MASRIFQWMKDAILQNKGMKFLALILAVITFYTIHNATNDEDMYVVPVSAEVEEDVEVVEQNPHSVTVAFRGSREDLKKLDPKYLKVELHPKFSEPGPIQIRPRDVNTVAGTRVVGISPTEAVFTLRKRPRIERPDAVPPPPVAPLERAQEIITREWTNVAVLAAGEARMVGTVMVSPPAVTLISQGPEGTVNSITSGTPVVFVDCSNLRVSEIVQRPIRIYDSGWSNVTFTVRPSTVEVSFWKNEKE